MLHEREFLESEFSKQIKEAFMEYEKDKEEINAHFIHQTFEEIQKYTRSCPPKFAMSSFNERLKNELIK